MWSFFFGQALGKERNLVAFLTQLVVGGVGVGLAFGLVVLYWISTLQRKHSHTDVTIQVALTIGGSYICFYVAEGMLEVSGVLAVVTMGVLLAATFWPLVCSRSTMENVRRALPLGPARLLL
jgi:NhaP-type Na+/H+ or K+/H+ antiporter